MSVSSGWSYQAESGPLCSGEVNAYSMLNMPIRTLVNMTLLMGDYNSVKYGLRRDVYSTIERETASQ